MNRIVVLSGAGISAESGLKTFRDAAGLWEGYRVEEVATPEAWRKDPALVQRFYNERRKQVIQAEPNEAHRALVKLENFFDTWIVTQNIDDLHERAGSKNVVHLHGEIRKSRSSVDQGLVYGIEGWELRLGEKCEKNSQLRPHVVWFGEAVPMMDAAIEIMAEASICMVIGTSLVVYPAASLMAYLPLQAQIYLIDPKAGEIQCERAVKRISAPATTGVPEAVSRLTQT